MKRFIPLILIEGATVMAVELCGAKLMAPLFGGSLFVWAAILAITLSALAFGYYFGGVISGKEKANIRLYQVIVTASVFIALMPFISIYLLPYISYLNFKVAVLLSAFLLIFFPIFLLGCTTPLFVRINTQSVETAGMISGKVYAISTVGGIASTLICGFFLIPFLGLKFTLLVFAALLFLTGTLVLKVFKLNPTLLLAVVFVFAAKLYAKSGSALYSNYSILGEIEVVDHKFADYPARQLLINQIVQTEMNSITKLSTSSYIRVIDSLVSVQTKPCEALILGLGGGLLANLLEKKNYVVDGVEFDPRIVDAAKTYFNLSKTVNTYCDDARYFINKSSKKYDLIVFDLFKAEEQPSHAITIESLAKLKQMLSPNGYMIINWHGYFKEPLGFGTRVLFNTLQSAQFRLKTVSTSGNEDHSNTLIVAKPADDIASMVFEPVNTDDVPLLEMANARANIRWRVNYLRYYQNVK
jgi:predicted membrane-bound spermidine synthase